jgi:NitT/TauT family transport system ATP-binding protein
MQQAQPVLTVSGLSFGYAGTDEVLRQVSFAVNAAEVVAVLGASGCGKSTLLNLIAGLLRPSLGSIAVGLGTTGSARRIGYIFQEDALLPWRTVRSNLSLATELGGISRERFEQQLPQFLTTFHLEAAVLERYPGQLSGGMRQRVSIIQSLMFDPQLLLLDEPFSALDFFTKLRLESEFYSLVKAYDKAAVLVTHDIEEAVAMADRVLIMERNGEIKREFAVAFASIQDRTPESVRGTPEFAELYRLIWQDLKTVIAG